MKKYFSKYRFYLTGLIIIITIDLFMIHQIEQRGSDLLTADMRRSASVCDELVFFPIARKAAESSDFAFVDSWQADRTFGGNRLHEGCDIIAPVNQRGIYPVVSMTDGIVEQIGWLELGGYRIGIRSPGGNYYYYAHMESYAEDLKAGSLVLAGQFLGFVGDSGYGEEGTTGQFAVHLHMGIYIPDEDGEDQAINPYPFLEHLQDKCILANYKEPES